MANGIPSYLQGKHNIVDDSFSYGTGLNIGNFCIIEEDVVVGSNVKISDYVKIPKGSRIGDNCTIGSYVRLGKRCRLGNAVVVKCHAVVSPDVVVEDYAFIGPNAILLHQTPDGKHRPCRIGKEVFIGTGVYVNPGVVIEEGIVIGSGSVVSKTLKVKGVYLGSPARLTKIPLVKNG